MDFLNIMTHDSFELYRSFESPNLVIKNSLSEFNFSIEFDNPQNHISSDSLTVQAVGVPEGFTATE